MNALVNQLKDHPPQHADCLVAVQSSITGYHHFRVRPLTGLRFPLIITREPNNVLHANALMVKSGPADMYPGSVRQFVSKEQLDVFAKEIGRCPRALADIIAPLFDQQNIIKGRSICTGQRDFRGRGPGGGMHLECIYILQAKNNATAVKLKSALTENNFIAFLLNNE